MAIAFRDSTGVTGQASSNPPVLLPATVQPGDVMLAVSSFSGTTQTLTTPAGWTALAGPIDKGTALREYLLWRIADGTDASSSVTFGWTANTAVRNTNIAIYSGADPTTPIHVSASKVETVAGTAHTSPTVTVAVVGCWIVEFCADRASPGSTSFTPTGLVVRDTRVATGGGAITSAVADSDSTVSTGTLGGESWAGTVSTVNAILWTVAIKPNTATGATPTPSPVTAAATVLAPTITTAAPATPTPAAVTATASVGVLVANVTAMMLPDATQGTATINTPVVVVSTSARALPEAVTPFLLLVGEPVIATSSAATVAAPVVAARALVQSTAPDVPGSATPATSPVPVPATVLDPVLHVGQRVIVAAVIATASIPFPDIKHPTPPQWREWNGVSEQVLTVVGVWDGVSVVTAPVVEVIVLR